LKIKKGKVANELVPMIAGTIQNQPCIFGELVESHSVYCDNDKSPYRKCHCSWYLGRAASIIDKCADENCEYFKANPRFVEDKKILAKDIAEELANRKKQRDWHNKMVKQGWLCPNCNESIGCNDKTTLCNSGTLVTGVVKIKDGKHYTDKEVDLHFRHDPMDVPMRKDCPCFSIKER
jgi:hypothetical protein